MPRFQLSVIASLLASTLSAGVASAQTARDSTSMPDAYIGIGVQASVKFNLHDPREKPVSSYLRAGLVIPGSPADSAGVEAGDTIVEINGEDTRTYSPAHPIPIVNVDIGQVFVMRIRRNGVDREIVVTAVPRPPDLPSMKELWERQKAKQ